ncbi:MAG: DUF1045 domain-containing protein [Xanthobacteraceae bacterium]|nr:DUF1045 domain-containing protein [Xanthobacteraceae bacterium]
MNPYPRYALYYAPGPRSELHRFGAQTIGYDAYSGVDVDFAQGVLRTRPDWADLTRDPRKYGFHATLKAPFFLRPGVKEDDLRAALVRFSQRPRARAVIEPVIRPIESFVAIVPSVTNEELNALASDCVAEFDDFRAPLTNEDRARRNPDTLTPSQQAYLDRWGYPYVMDDFRFHMTLTGSLQPEQSRAILPMLQQSFGALGITSLAIDRIAMFRQDSAETRFSIVACHEIAG